MSITSTYDHLSFWHTIEGLFESHICHPHVNRTWSKKNLRGSHIFGVSRANKVILVALREVKMKRQIMYQTMSSKYKWTWSFIFVTLNIGYGKV